MGQTAKKTEPKDPRYVRDRSVLERGAEPEMKTVAAAEATQPEMLYYLAENGDADVRALVAGNRSAPLQADDILSADEVDEVRAAVAVKIARLLPDLTQEAQGKLGAKSLEILARLAQDELPRVRAIVAEAVKESRAVPADMVRGLAKDVEQAVAAPVLQYSPLLTEDDLSEIIAAGAASGALNAIAKRADLPDTVSHDLAATLDTQAVAALLENDSAQIREDTLDAIIDQAPQAQSWHRPLAMRESLSLRAMKRISGFVASFLVGEMVDRHGLDEKAAEEVLAIARTAIQAENVDDDLDAQWHAEAQELLAGEPLTDAAVRDLVKGNKRGVLIHALAIQTEISMSDIKTILSSKDARLVTSLIWKAGLSMRTAVNVQRAVVLINAGDIVLAENGFDYPLADKDMDWLLASHTSD
ncbi:MAG: DUF2336 domain-containing protein [Pseudomonadota bacterium]